MNLSRSTTDLSTAVPPPSPLFSRARPSPSSVTGDFASIPPNHPSRTLVICFRSGNGSGGKYDIGVRARHSRRSTYATPARLGLTDDRIPLISTQTWKHSANCWNQMTSSRSLTVGPLNGEWPLLIMKLSRCLRAAVKLLINSRDIAPCLAPSRPSTYIRSAACWTRTARILSITISCTFTMSW